MALKFGNQMKAIREKNNWTLEEMAAKLGTTKQALSKYERGERTPKVTLAAQFADKLGVDLRVLVGEEETTMELHDPVESEDYDRLEALHQDKRLRMLFDRSRKMSDADKDKMIQIANVILGELYPDD
jgi:transcriptional regulator with XRE-family HTH domain